jgi:lipopolysaccharide/colanic/teichoic acid biosynthesis glycosyltransferase
MKAGYSLKKRVFDLALVGPGLLLAAPMAAIVALLVHIKLGRPVLFRQERPGFQGRPFILLKFRTMSNAVDENGEPLPDELRLGRFGRFLRRTSLDELPSLLNVIRGEMSLVGPRPLLMEYLDLYTPEQACRHDVLPGLTGLAQVAGRNELSWPERLRLDTEYVDRWSTALDLRILARTVWLVARGHGVSQEGHATVARFTGAEPDAGRG